jgi:ABC-type uncharacterized transport system permease subunit
MLSSHLVATYGHGPLLLASVATLLYLVAALPAAMRPQVEAAAEGLRDTLLRLSAAALLGGFVLHLLLLVVDIGGVGQPQPGARLGFGPVLSMTVWLVIAVHTVESRFVPLPAVRAALALAGAAAVVLAATFPGEIKPQRSALAPLHFVLGVGSYGLFGAAVLHALLLDAAERRLRGGGAARAAMAAAAAGGAARAGAPPGALGMPLLQLERLTFRFVQAGFVVLTATLVLGAITAGGWRTEHKTVFSLLAWGVFAALLVGRWRQGWRGRRATRWLYAGTVLLLLAYAGSRFVLEVLLPPAAG